MSIEVKKGSEEDWSKVMSLTIQLREALEKAADPNSFSRVVVNNKGEMEVEMDLRKNFPPMQRAY